MRPIPKKEELSDYEKIRQENIAEQRLKFLQVMIRTRVLWKSENFPATTILCEIGVLNKAILTTLEALNPDFQWITALNV